jgi:phosphate transport system substrate-binding protein
VNFKRLGTVGAIAVAGSILLASCTATEPGTEEPTDSSLSGTLVGVGASAQGSAQEAWIVGFQSIHGDGVTVNYSPDGSGAGRDAFRGGGAQFAGTDRAFKDDEIAEDAFGTCVPGTDIIELPAYISPIAIAFNLPGIDSLNMDADTIAKIFLGDITSWDDAAIASQNDGVDLPALAIEPVYRADNSGTTDNFTDYLSAAAPSVWTHGAVGDWPVQVGTAAPQTSGVADALKNEGTFGYLDASRATGLGTVAVKVGDEYVPYSAEAAAAIVDASPLVDGRTEFDFAVDIDRDTTESGVYPVVLISYIVTCVEFEDKSVVDLVKGFLSYVVSAEGQDAAADNAGSAPISDDFRSKAEAAIAAIN